MESKTILEQQRKNWNLFAPGWDKWEQILMPSMQTFTDTIVSKLKLKGNEHILDVASGTGEPGLSICANLPNGKVIATDLSERMVEIANENAKRRGIVNFQSQVGDASNLPFEHDTFDRIVSRFGIMFFPDMKKGIREMKRVLKPGGRLAIAVWATPDLNPHISLMASVVMQKLDLPKPLPEAPGIFRCAKPGFLNRLFVNAGLKNISKTNVKAKIGFDSPEHYWQVMADVAGPIMQVLKNAPQGIKKEVKETAIKKSEDCMVNGKLQLAGEAIIVTGKKK